MKRDEKKKSQQKYNQSSKECLRLLAPNFLRWCGFGLALSGNQGGNTGKGSLGDNESVSIMRI